MPELRRAIVNKASAFFAAELDGPVDDAYVAEVAAILGINPEVRQQLDVWRPGRPPESSSIVSAIFGVMAGDRYGELMTDWPKLIRRVVAATVAAIDTDSHTPSIGGLLTAIQQGILEHEHVETCRLSMVARSLIDSHEGAGLSPSGRPKSRVMRPILTHPT